MTIHTAILNAYPQMNDAQREIVEHTEGPLLVIAGPGSGKTFVLILRTLNLLLSEKAEPKEIVLCTFTEKAAFELRDRLSTAAQKVGFDRELGEMLLGTIHSIANTIVDKNRHHTRLGNNYEVLDDLTQLLFLHEHFDEILGEPDGGGKFLGKWTSHWHAIKGIANYLNRITEELIDPNALMASEHGFVRELGRSVTAYEQALEEKNALDFAHQQALCYELLCDPHVEDKLTNSIKYVMVDEYQDTNYVQEQLVLRLAGAARNICVVGDDDQALYRFRGATVRNILEFPKTVPGTPMLELSTNYRSHKAIIARYNAFMDAANWIDKAGNTYRFEKSIHPDPEGVFPGYPAVFSTWGKDEKDEARRLADLVAYMKREEIIEDYSQVALLLHSVRSHHSGRYIEALEAKGIPVFCPRAREYFENEEIKLMVGCYALLLGWHGPARGDIWKWLEPLAEYVDECLIVLARTAQDSPRLLETLRKAAGEIEALTEDGKALDRRPADYFYDLLACDPFRSMANEENRARNLSTFSNLLNTFQNYYHTTVISWANRGWLRRNFFNSYLRLLFDGGINEYVDPDNPFPKGHVQVITIHQSKGLEFPVVVVGSLTNQLNSGIEQDRVLGPYMHRPPFEPTSRFSEFDRMRQHYVAFSRAEKVLVLTADEMPKPQFRPIWDGLPQWPYVEQDLLAAQSFELKDRMPVKKAYSFTSDLKVYETCPRQYRFFRYLDFAPARSAEMFFGALVHQTIEDIHRWVLDGQSLKLIENAIPGLFDANFRTLAASGIRPIGQAQRAIALQQVQNYYRQAKNDLSRVLETEVDVSVEKGDYILTGKVDLLLGKDDRLELLDFKSQTRPRHDDARVRTYYLQICIYAHILEQRYGKRPERLLLYWTGEAMRTDALMEFAYDPADVHRAGAHFDAIVERIRQEDFVVRRVPEVKVCTECDLRRLCHADGIITRSI